MEYPQYMITHKPTIQYDGNMIVVRNSSSGMFDGKHPTTILKANIRSFSSENKDLNMQEGDQSEV